MLTLYHRAPSPFKSSPASHRESQTAQNTADNRPQTSAKAFLPLSPLLPPHPINKPANILLNSFITGTIRDPKPKAKEVTMTSPKEHSKPQTSGQRKELTPDQRHAAEKILPILTKQSEQRQVVLAGYAGTGKSFTTGVIAGELKQAGYEMLAVTHAHKALSVITEQLPEGVEVATIFSALGWRINPRTQDIVTTGRHKLVAIDVLIVDEASMVDRRMMAEITKLSELLGFTVLWIGDPAQLPPVGEEDGIPPVFQIVEEQARLTGIVRQAKDSPIIRASMYLRECLQKQIKPDLMEMQAKAGNDGEMQLINGGALDAASYMLSAIEHNLDARYVAFTNKAVTMVNTIVTKQTHPPGSERIIAGDPVTFGSSYYQGERRVAATDSQATVTASERVGVHGVLELECLKVTLNVGERTETVYAPCDGDGYSARMRKIKRQHGDYRRAAKKAQDDQDWSKAQQYLGTRDELGVVIQRCSEDYADLRHIYAITAHKSQGSTFDVAIIDWQDMAKNGDATMLCRLLYVACTRPSKYLVILT